MEKTDAFHIPNDLYGFAFAGLPARMLYRLRKLDMCYIVWSNNIDHYLDMLIHEQPKQILGLGTYSGVDQEALIE